MSDETTPILTRKVFNPVETNFVPGERSMVAWISTDCVDHEKDVVVSSGIDYKTYFLGKTPEQGNPCVLAFHDLGRWPLGRCEWVKIKQGREFNGLYAKTLFDDDPETDVVWRKIKSGSLRGISVGFRPPDDLKPGEWGPPTRDELLRRPEWKTAQRIIRRCVLLEYSVCTLGMNPQALVAAVNKGVHRPVYSIPKAPTMAQTDVPPEAEDDETKCSCGEKDCDKCGMAEGSTATGGAAVKPVVKPKDMDDDEEEEKAVDPEALAEAEAEEEATEDEPDEEPEDDDSEEEGGGFKRGDHVKVKAPHYKGFGAVMGVHKHGLVPHADNDMMASKDDPAARVKCYKAFGDGHKPTDFHVAVKCAHLTKLGTPLNPPSKKPAPAPAAKTVRTEPAVEPLPPLIAKSDQQLQKELAEQIKSIPQLVNDAIAKYVGVV